MTPEQLQQVLQQAMGSQPPWYVTGLLAALVGAAVAYFGPYLGEKAKIKAIEENLGKLVEQVRQTTMATEDIKAQIAGGLWLEQKRWDLRWDHYRRLLENLGDLIALMDGLANMGREIERDPDGQSMEGTKALMNQYYQNATTAYKEILRVTWTSGAFLNQAATEAIHEMRERWSNANQEKENWRTLEQLINSSRKAYSLLMAAASEDLMDLSSVAEQWRNGSRRI